MRVKCDPGYHLWIPVYVIPYDSTSPLVAVTCDHCGETRAVVDADARK